MFPIPLAAPFVPFLYSNGQMKDLGTLGGGDYSYPWSINDAGQVTGSSITAAGFGHAFMYSDGQMQDLNYLIDPELDITLTNANAINDEGQIVATGVSASGNPHAYLLTPVPEPSTIALFGVALLGLAGSSRFRRKRILNSVEHERLINR